MFEVLHSKIHRATLTGADLNYEGSISISVDLIEKANMKPYQKVLIADLENGNRFETYIIVADTPNTFCVNGSAARMVHPGDKVIIMAFKFVDEIEDGYQPTVLLMNEKNEVYSG